MRWGHRLERPSTWRTQQLSRAASPSSSHAFDDGPETGSVAAASVLPPSGLDLDLPAEGRHPVAHPTGRRLRLLGNPTTSPCDLEDVADKRPPRGGRCPPAMG